MSNEKLLQSRREALKCMAYGGAGTLFVLAGGVFTPMDLASARVYDEGKEGKALGNPLFVQISDTHIGFNKEANPDVNATLMQTIDLVNGMSKQPALSHPYGRYHASVEARRIRSGAAAVHASAHDRAAHGSG